MITRKHPPSSPSALSQVTVHYTQKDGAVIPVRVHTVVISVQHDDHVSLEEQQKVLKEKVIKAVIPSKYLDEDTIYHLQPSGRFVIGGPQVKLTRWPGGLRGNSGEARSHFTQTGWCARVQMCCFPGRVTPA